MDLRTTQLKDTYGNLVTTGTTEGAPTSGGLQNGQGTLLTSVGIGVTPETWYTPLSTRALQIGNTTSLWALNNGSTDLRSTFDNNLYISGAGANTYLNTGSASRYQQVNGTHKWYNAPSGTEDTTATLTELMQIKNTGDISFRDGSANEAFYWDASSARLGLGTTSPNHQLEIYGGSGAGSYNLFRGFSYNGATNKRVEINIDNTEADPIAIWNTTRSGGAVVEHSFQIDSSEKMRIDSSGNVGIGTDSPTVPSSNATTLHIKGAVATKGGAVRLSSSDDSVDAYLYPSSSSFNIGSITSHDVNIVANNSARMTIDTSGNVLIGTTATPTSSAGNIVLKNGTAPTGNATDGVILYAEDVSTSSELKVRDEAGNVTTLSPHNFSLIPDGASEPMAWAYYSERDGKKINVDMLKLARMVESLTGEKLVYEQ